MKTRNKFETKIKRQLSRSKIKFSYETEKISYVLVRYYVPDFILESPDGKIYIECKGFFRREDKAKLRAVKKASPGIDLRIVFYTRRESDIKWAERNSIPYAIGKIPKEWLTW